MAAGKCSFGRPRHRHVLGEVDDVKMTATESARGTKTSCAASRSDYPPSKTRATRNARTLSVGTTPKSTLHLRVSWAAKPQVM